MEYYVLNTVVMFLALYIYLILINPDIKNYCSYHYFTNEKNKSQRI